MMYFKVTTDDEIFVIQGKTRIDAECEMVREKFPELYDDELSDKYDIEEISMSERKYIKDYTSEELIMIRERDIDTKIDQAREDAIHSHYRR